jgi:hypothetical protein
LHAWPWSQRPAAHITELLGLVPPPQHDWLSAHAVPVRRQPPAGRHTVAPEPGSKQMREQQLLPPVQGLPAWVQPPPPEPLTSMQRPALPPVPLHTLPQQSELVKQTSPVGWQ